MGKMRGLVAQAQAAHRAGLLPRWRKYRVFCWNREPCRLKRYPPKLSRSRTLRMIDCRIHSHLGAVFQSRPLITRRRATIPMPAEGVSIAR